MTLIRHLIIAGTIAVCATGAQAQSAEGGAALQVHRSLSVATLSPMRLDRDSDAAALVAQNGVTADSAAVIRLSGDAGRAYRIRLPRRNQADWRELSIWSANDGDISDGLSGRLDAEGQDTLRITGRTSQHAGMAVLPVSIDYD